MGDQLRGAAGAAIGAFGFLVGPFLAVIALSTAFDRLPDVAALEAVSQGVAFAALGLLLVICLRGVQRARRFPPALIVIAVTAICVGLLRWPLIPVVLVIAPISASRSPGAGPEQCVTTHSSRWCWSSFRCRCCQSGVARRSSPPFSMRRWWSVAGSIAASSSTSLPSLAPLPARARCSAR